MSLFQYNIEEIPEQMPKEMPHKEHTPIKDPPL